MNHTLTHKASEIIMRGAELKLLKKAVFSKPSDKSIVKSVATLIKLGDKLCVQIETFRSDNKATHKNLSLYDADDFNYLCSFASDFSQINIITSVGQCEYRKSSSGKEILIGGDKLVRALENDTSNKEVCVGGNNRQKASILKGDEPFLIELGVSDKNGRPHDKKLPKLRQINRFLEYVRDIEKHLPTNDPLYICDLCCGKSYLSFAVYYYFANIKKRDTVMIGVDLKSDVIEYCNSVAQKLGFNGLTFLCEDVRRFDTENRPSLVVSLHACDIATDIVLEKATEWNAKVILSTPCCHHEMNHNLNCPALSFIAEHSMLRQKFCDAATDSLRLKLLQANGYTTQAVELVDPDDTPKNILLRAVKSKDGINNKYMEEYIAAYTFLYGKAPETRG